MCRVKHRLLLAIAFTGVLLLAPGSRGELKKGDRSPDLKSFRLERTVPDTRGKVVLLDFWASWCAPCKASFPEMENLYEQYGPRGFTIVAVSVDEKRAN